MQKRLEDQASGRIRIAPPSVEPFSLPRPAHPRPRPVALDAAVCFLATALGSLSPQALDLLDLAPTKAALGHVDPESGKFTDRILIGGLQPLNANDTATPTPAFTKVSAPASASEAAVAAPLRAVPVPPAKPARELAQRRTEKAPEPKIAAAPPPAPLPVVAPVAEPKPAPDALAEAKPATAAEQGVLSTLAPTALTSRLAPVGEKMVNGARAIGGVVSSGLAWIGY